MTQLPPCFYSPLLCLYPFHLTASTISLSHTHTRHSLHHSRTNTHYSLTLRPSLSLSPSVALNFLKSFKKWNWLFAPSLCLTHAYLFHMCILTYSHYKEFILSISISMCPVHHSHPYESLQIICHAYRYNSDCIIYNKKEQKLVGGQVFCKLPEGR